MSSPADIDIWRTANLLIERHGSEAAIVAARRADELLAKGDIDGQLVWKRVLQAIEGLQRTKPLNGGAPELAQGPTSTYDRTLPIRA